MDQTEARQAARSIFVTLGLGAIALLLMAAVSDRQLLRARPIHRAPLACAPVEAVPVGVALDDDEPAPEAPVRKPSHTRPARKAERGTTPRSTATELRQKTEACKDDPLCGISVDGK